MDQKELFDQLSTHCARLTTKAYSTSFSLGILCLENRLRNPIYSIYGFVRFADEVVDSFHNYDKSSLLNRFRRDTCLAIEEKISLNPILNSFQHTVNEFNIEPELIDQFLNSMQMDLTRSRHDHDSLAVYILGSAEVVGLMCLRVFCNGDNDEYQRLKPFAMKLGSAFQKVNFLRDLNADYAGLGRTYFPGLDFSNLCPEAKSRIEDNIAADFREGFEGIRQLPRSARFGVYVAYAYYQALFRKIKNTPSEKVLGSRIRITNSHKFSLLCYSFVKHQLNRI